MDLFDIVKDIIESSEAYLRHKRERSLARLAAREKEIASAGPEAVKAKDLQGVTNPRRGHRPGIGRNTGWLPVRATTPGGTVVPRDMSLQRSSTDHKELLGPAVKNIIEAKDSRDTGGLSGKKSRAKVYDSISDALKKGYYGQIFSTKAANRMYVITRRKWGTDDEQAVGSKVAKGFSPGTIPSSFKDVKGYAVRTMVRHGKQKSKKFKGEKYWKGEKKDKD